MPKPVAANPKHTHIRKVLAKVRPSLVRGVGMQAKSQGNAASAEAGIVKLEQELAQALQSALAVGGSPAVDEKAPLPQNGWVYQALSGRRNAKHGNSAAGPAVAVMHEGRMAVCGVLLAEAEDLVLAGAGEGCSGPNGRLRVSNRDLADALVMLPMSSIDTAKLKVMEHADAVAFHTRKSGNVLADAIAVAAARADGMLATRFTPFEMHCVTLMVKEAGGTVKVLETPAGPVLLAGTLKVVNGLAELMA